LGDVVAIKSYMDAEDLEGYRMLCQWHIDVRDLANRWLLEEKYKFGSQVRRSSNRAPAHLAEKNMHGTHPKNEFSILQFPTPDTRHLTPFGFPALPYSNTPALFKNSIIINRPANIRRRYHGNRRNL
jgi:hypothetical protein